MVVVGSLATVATAKRGEPAAIWGTVAYFTAIEGLQLAGYAVVDQCDTTANKSITLLSYLHVALQPVVINTFALQLVPEKVRKKAIKPVMLVCVVTVALMLAQLIPWRPLGKCLPGTPLCGETLCTVSGNWHIAWQIPYNGLLVPFDTFFGTRCGFPAYVFCFFVLPLFYGAWRFVLLNVLAGPVFASVLTDNPNEMPAVWCLLSIAIVCICLSPVIRQRVSTGTWWGATP
jgi:hypothetical protein